GGIAAPPAIALPEGNARLPQRLCQFHAWSNPIAGLILRALAASCAVGRTLLRAVVIFLLCLMAWTAPAAAQSSGGTGPSLMDRLTPQVLAGVFPGVTRVEVLSDR